MKPRVKLSAEQLAELEQASKHHEKAYVRTKALVLLNLAADDAPSLTQLARCFRVSRPSVYAWRQRYLAHGLSGLAVREGRGRKGQADLCELVEHVQQSPRNFGVEQTRWTLQALANEVFTLHGMTPSGVWRALRRAGYSYKRGQPVPHSPDPLYDEKKTP